MSQIYNSRGVTPLLNGKIYECREIIKLNKALYSSLTSSDKFGRFFNKSILHYAAIMEVFSYNKLEGISYEKLCLVFQNH